MLFPWQALALLALECQAVVGLRTMKLMLGGWAAQDEARLMVGEKVGATFEAAGMLMAGRPAGDVVARYRELVADNAARLSGMVS